MNKQDFPEAEKKNLDRKNVNFESFKRGKFC